MAATSAGMAQGERGRAMARMRTAHWLDVVGYLMLVGVLLVVIVAQDGQRREALDAKAAATAEVENLRYQSRCENGLQAQWASALLAYIVALNSGEGAAVALSDAQRATASWQEAQQRCATR